MSEFVTRYLDMMCSLRASPLPAGFNYSCVEDYVRDRGVNYASAELTAAERQLVKKAIANMIDRRMRPKQCFYNSQLLAIADRTNQLTYCEGFAVCGLIPLHHGWCVLNGKVLDLTWRLRPKNAKVYGVFPADWAYLGVAFDTEMISAQIAATGATQSFLDDYTSDWALFKQPRAVR